MEEWDRIAWLCMHMPRFSKKRVKLEDFHPFRGKQAKQFDFQKWRQWRKKVKNILPATLTEDEIAAKWEIAKEKLDASRRQ